MQYPQQIAYLRESHGFNQAHANALVMYVRNSPASKRFKTPDDFFATLDPVAATTAHDIFAAITNTYPALELVIAWNQPMLRIDGKYVIGLSAAKNHLLLNPFSGDVLATFAEALAGYEVNKRTFKVPLDWEVGTRNCCAAWPQPVSRNSSDDPEALMMIVLILGGSAVRSSACSSGQRPCSAR